MIIRWGSGCCAHARAPQGFTAGLPESSRSKHDTPQHRYLTVVVYTRVLHSTVSPISSTNHPRSLPVPNRPSAGSKAANMASVGLRSSLKSVLNLLKIFFILWLFYSHHFDRGEREFLFPVIPGNTSLKFPFPSLPVAFCNFPSRSRENKVLAGN